MGFFDKQEKAKEAVHKTDSGISVKNVHADAPPFKRTYTTKLSDRASVEVTTKTFIGSRMNSGELTQPNGRWLLFDPERIADKILDPVLVPLVEAFVKEVFELDKAFMASKPSEFTDDHGTTWRRCN